MLKKLILLLLLLFFISSVYATPSEISWYGYDETVLNSIADSSSNGFDMTAETGINLNVAGKIGSGLTVGTASNQSTFHRDSLSLTKAFSFSFWINLTTSIASQPYTYPFITAYDDAGGYSENRAFALYLDKGLGKIYIDGRDDSGNNVFKCYYTVGTDIDVGWHHIAFTKGSDDLNSEVELYIDGVEVSSYDTQEDNGYALNSTPSYFQIGATRNANNSVSATYDDFRVFDEKLAPAEISAIYNSGDGTESSLAVLSVDTGTLISSGSDTPKEIDENITFWVDYTDGDSNDLSTDACIISFDSWTSNSNMVYDTNAFYYETSFDSNVINATFDVNCSSTIYDSNTTSGLYTIELVDTYSYSETDAPKTIFSIAQVTAHYHETRTDDEIDTGLCIISIEGDEESHHMRRNETFDVYYYTFTKIVPDNYDVNISCAKNGFETADANTLVVGFYALPDTSVTVNPDLDSGQVYLKSSEYIQDTETTEYFNFSINNMNILYLIFGAIIIIGTILVVRR